MTLNTRQNTAGDAQNMEGSGATWVCDNDPSHTEPADN
jgi:hypothetical protein